MCDYDQLAALLGQFPDLAIFRAFTKLSAKTLLYMQADLVHEEAQLEDLELEDGLSGDPQKSSYRHSWYGLSRSSENGNDDLQLQKILRIRRKLQEYREFHFLCQLFSSKSKEAVGFQQCPFLISDHFFCRFQPSSIHSTPPSPLTQRRRPTVPSRMA